MADSEDAFPELATLRCDPPAQIRPYQFEPRVPVTSDIEDDFDSEEETSSDEDDDYEPRLEIADTVPVDEW